MPEFVNILIVLLRARALHQLTWLLCWTNFFRIAALDNPEADYTMDWIAQTNNEWLRQKTIQEGKVLSFRSIIKIDRQQHSIDLVIILLRSDDTYDIAERLWRDEE